jgi:4'-phosphopantetheinyl transferase
MSGSTGIVVVRWAPIPSDVDLRRSSDLVAAERERALALLPAARAQFAVSRSVARRLTSELLGIAPGSVRFDRDELGRPTVNVASASISITHTTGMAAVAIAIGRPVGIDMEPNDRHPFPPGHLWLTPSERDAVNAHGGGERRELLLRLWTAKEAVVKALGVGSQQPFRTIDILTDEPGWFRVGVDDGARSLEWLTVVPGHLVALATVLGPESAAPFTPTTSPNPSPS